MRKVVFSLILWLCATPLLAQNPVSIAKVGPNTTVGTTVPVNLPATGSPADAESNTFATLPREGQYGFMYNGTSWDRLRGDTTNGLWVNVKASVALAVSQSGSWTVSGSGNFTVVQATGTNLHMVCDSGCAGSGGTSITDNGAFTQGSTLETPASGLAESSIDNSYTSATAGHSTVWQMTPKGHGVVDLSSVFGSNIATAATGIIKVGVTDGSGTAINSTSNALNAFITNPSASGTNAASSTANESIIEQDAPVTITTTLQNAAVANGNGTQWTVTGEDTLSFTVKCSVSCSGGTTLNFEASEDATNYIGVFCTQDGTSTIASTQVLSGTGASTWTCPITNKQKFQARISAYSAGTITVTAHASPVAPHPWAVNANIVNSIPAGSALIGETAPVATATTTDATATCYLTSTASTNSTSCKGSAGNVYAIHVTNTTTTNYFLRMYNASSAPTCSSATGFVETIPALGAAANGAVNGRSMAVPQAYSTGIGFCLTGGGSSTDNTNAATGVYITITYK